MLSTSIESVVLFTSVKDTRNKFHHFYVSLLCSSCVVGICISLILHSSIVTMIHF